MKGPHKTMAELARQRNTHPVDLMIDMALERDFKFFMIFPVANESQSDALELMRHPRSVVTFSDSGAHVSQIMDTSLQTHLLSHWVREKQAFTLEQAVKMITCDNATQFGFHDRGLIREGMAADLAVFDPDTVGPRMPEAVCDLPAGAKRLKQTCDGMKATIVNGEVLLRDNQPTGNAAGQASAQEAALGNRMGRTAMTFDLVVRNGTIIDGSGLPRYRADIAVKDGRIAEIGRLNGVAASETLDAEGRVVAPGFVDGHTHMDAQIFWDPIGTSSCFQGVTSVLMGNCGFTLAPCRESEADLVMRNLERAEDISRAAMKAGIKWRWETFPEFLDVLDSLPKGINYAGYMGHCALRTYVMGQRAFTDAATADDLAAMVRHTRESHRRRRPSAFPPRAAPAT